MEQVGELPGLVNIQSYWKLPFIVDLPINNGWIFHSYVTLPEGNHMIYPHKLYIFHISRTYSIDIPMITVLVGGFNLPLWNIWVRQLGWFFHIISNIWKNKTYSKPPTSCIVGCSFVASLADCRFYCPHLSLQIHHGSQKESQRWRRCYSESSSFLLEARCLPWWCLPTDRYLSGRTGFLLQDIARKKRV